MRAVNLAKVAAQAELLRWRRLAKRQAVRVALAVVGAFFLIATLVSLHVAGAMALALVVPPVYAALIVAALDLVIAVVFFVIASGSKPDRIEQEALQVRLAAQEQMLEAAALTSLIGPLLRMLGTRKVYGLALAALTARYLGGNRR